MIEMESLSYPVQSQYAGSVVVVTGITDALGWAAARSFAGASPRMLVSAPVEWAATDRLDELRRIRSFKGLDEPLLFVPADSRTEVGAGEIVRTVQRHYGRIDALVHSLAVRPLISSDGSPADVDLSEFLPLVLSSLPQLTRQDESNIVLTAYLTEEAARVIGPTAHEATETALRELVSQAAGRYFERGVNLNGLLMADPPSAETGGSVNGLKGVSTHRQSSRFTDVAHLVRFLASTESRGVTGQVFVVGGGAPPAPSPVTAACRERALTDSALHRLRDSEAGLAAGGRIAGH
jgi:NAD(P)-dependent dehydrogenase (short-subunit alcohol dehydrogenase family)